MGDILADVTKNRPQYGALTPKWITKLLEFKGLGSGIYRVNRVKENETPLDVLCIATKKSDIVPHIARKITRTSENSAVIPVCALLGGAFLCICDTLARTLFSPYELPTGIVVSYIGVPFFIWLLIRKKGEKHSA